MSQDVSAPAGPSIALYDRQTVYAMLREWTPRRLRDELWAGHFGARLSPAAASELEEHLTAWVQRALGLMTLRDVLMVDSRRGPRVFALICAELTAASAAVPPGLASYLPSEPGDLEALPPVLASDPDLAALEQRAAAEGLSMAALTDDRYPFPTDLEHLLAPAPTEHGATELIFEQPTGWRRLIAILLVTSGAGMLILPMLLGHIPEHPAGLPLALLTLGLLVGISAGWVGFAGGLCIWLVANLPGFRHGSSLLAILWPALPLMATGVGLLSLDRRVRALWRWVRQQVSGGR